jgi:hypothetical protein
MARWWRGAASRWQDGGVELLLGGVIDNLISVQDEERKENI